jgi:hypothetical protein
VKTIVTALFAAGLLLCSPLSAAPLATYTPAASTRDGHKDFDFLLGTWRTHYQRLRHPLSNSHDWYGCDGTSVVRPFWGGSADLQDGDLHCPGRYVGGMTIRLYNAATHQWTLTFGTRTAGLELPAQIGHFDANGVGEFFAYDTFKGKPVMVRFKWAARNGHPHFDQAYSTDNGRSWEANWISDYTRVSPSTNGVWNAPATTHDGRNGFDFLMGRWRTHYRILRHRLVGNHDWVDCYGTSIVRPFWAGGANLEDGDLKCPDRYVGGMTLRLYDAPTHRWTLWWGTRKLGIAPPPQVGHFEKGAGDFYAPDIQEGRHVIVRFRWTQIDGNPHFEQAFSSDKGKTWETNWTTDYRRVPASTQGVWNATS